MNDPVDETESILRKGVPADQDPLPDPQTRQAIADYAEDQEDPIGQGFDQEVLKTLTQERSQRKAYAIAIFVVVCLWLIFVAIVVCVQLGKKDGLSDGVLITLLTTTTANVLGLWFIVGKYFYSVQNMMSQAIEARLKKIAERRRDAKS
ncbi:MAG: hypothetical protein EDM74_05350 [Armatimonadetes bacterium]|nr:MAG: hypothetical protein EDM74_05350 [Armatimonadota bacterium]